MRGVLVLLDSTVLVADRFLASNDSRLLLSAARSGELHLGVTEVTLREAVNKVREKAQEALDKISGGLAALTTLRAEVTGLISDVTAESVAESYGAFLREELRRNRVEVFPTPGVAHAEVVERALLRRKPFDRKGHVGYRDALIWETIREIAKGTDEPIAFVSTNHRDFAEAGKGSGLARSLAEELAADGSSATVELYDDLKSFLDASLRPAADALEELRGRLADDPDFRTQLEQDIETALDRDDPDVEGIDPVSLVENGDAEYELDEVTLYPVDPGVSHVDIVSAHALDEEQILLDLYVEADFDVEFTVYRIARLWRRGMDSPYPDDHDEPPRRMSGIKTRTLSVSLEATHYPSRRSVEDVRMIAVGSIGPATWERRERLHRHIARAPERRQWERRARAAAIAWAKAHGFDRVVGESTDSLRINSDADVLLIEFVEDPDLITWLQAAARKLGYLRSMIGRNSVRAAIVLSRSIDTAVAARLQRTLEPPIELYVLDGDALHPLDA